MPSKEDWTKWNEVRNCFQDRDTEGFTKDLEALRAHIKTLRDVSPKDKAGVPETTALLYLDRLTAEYNRFKNYMESVSS